MARINTKFGTSFTDATFDAPRNQGRGPWDAYLDANPFFAAWVEYNRQVVSMRIANNAATFSGSG